MSKQKLQLHQFTINKDTIEKHTLFVYTWPKEIKLAMLEANLDKFVIKDLHDFILLFNENILFVNSVVNEDNLWFISLSEIDCSILQSHIYDWLQGGKKPVISSISIEPPTKYRTTDLFAREFEPYIYNVIPQLYAKHFASMLSKCNLSYASDFSLVANECGRCISEPVASGFKRKSPNYYSYFIDVTLVKPFADRAYFVNVYTGICAWISSSIYGHNDGKIYLERNSTQSLYFSSSSIYEKTTARQFIKLKYRRNFNEVQLVGSHVKLAKKYNLNFEDSLRNPINYLNLANNNGYQMILLLDSKLNKYIRKGAGLPERQETFNRFKSCFPNLRPVKLISELKVDKEIKISINKDRSDSLCNPFLNNGIVNVSFDVYTDKQVLFEEFKSELIRILNLEKIDDSVYKRKNEMIINVSKRDNRFARLLDYKGELGKSEREKEISNILDSHQDEATKLAIIDIPAYHESYNMKDYDCKESIRSAFQEKGIITQFINSDLFEGENGEVQSKHRIVSSVFDLLSSFGFISNNYFNCGMDQKIMLGLSTIRYSKGEYVAISKIEEGKVTYRLPGLPNQSWLSLKEIIPILRSTHLVSISRDKAAFSRWIHDELLNVCDSKKDVVLVYDAALRNKYWDVAKNGAMKLSDLSVSKKANLTFVRVNAENEIPGYSVFTNQDTDEPNRRQGLFIYDNSRYFSIAQKPSTNQVRNSLTKNENPSAFIAKQRIVELTVLSLNEEENQKIAMLIHEARKLSISTVEMTKYPWPIHLINRLSEYMF